MSRIALVVIVLLLMAACGSPEGESKTLPPTGGGDTPDALVQAECGRCHNGRVQSPVIQSVAQLKRAHAKALIQSGRMPPDRRLAADVKGRLVSLAE
jgi:cytochrome c553